MKRKICFRIFAAIFILVMAQSCTVSNFRTNYDNVNSLIHQTASQDKKPFLKAHLKNGDVVIFSDRWQLDTNLNTLNGSGIWYNFNRHLVSEGSISLPVDSVVIFESNTKIQGPKEGIIAALTILTAIDVFLGVYCLSVPKACFGSCPTFYISENNNIHSSDAEGFSDAICPFMEYEDIDALNNGPVEGNLFSIIMKNEALETHCVRDVKLLACPRKKGERVYHSADGEFYLCKNIYPLSHATAAEGDITSLLAGDDKQERFSGADENNLCSKEEILLEFDKAGMSGKAGLILHFRQSLMTTYLLYNAIGYMGDEVGDMFAKLTTDKAMRERFSSKNRILGGIDVYQWDGGKNNWDFRKSFYETGPIAINKQFIELRDDETGPPVKLKIVLNKGSWRLDYAALADIVEKVVPVEVIANSISKEGSTGDREIHLFHEKGSYLITMPGDVYRFDFLLPAGRDDCELFLSSRGYYLEWIREHWLKDKDLPKLRQMVFEPFEYYKNEAVRYKAYENMMEQEFWNSKIDTKKSSYHEN